jgi:hypothetical protein
MKSCGASIIFGQFATELEMTDKIESVQSFSGCYMRILRKITHFAQFGCKPAEKEMSN